MGAILLIIKYRRLLRTLQFPGLCGLTGKRGLDKLVTSTYRKSAYIIIDAERCKGCHLCVSVCPGEVIGLSDHINQKGYTPAVVLEEKASECTGCTVCAMMCPDAAISVYRHSPVLSRVA